ncbi:MAG: M3 family metallopeptidase [Myxococcales bacterium]|nr:M3 family metallopeptidase [Myxococcales bacterium]
MRTIVSSWVALALALAPLACTKPTTPATAAPSSPAAAAAPAADEPAAPAGGEALLAEWEGPYGGVPAFDRMQLSDLEPAMERGMAMHLAELEAIASDPAPPTFENTIVAMERAGAALRRVEVYYGIWRSNLSSPEFRELDERLSPAYAEYESKITQNAALFARVAAVHRSAAMAERSPAERRLVQLVYDDFARDGATLEGPAKQRYAEIQRRLAELHNAFGNNVLADEEGYVLLLDESQLGGLPESFRAAAAAAAAERGQAGKYAVTNTRSSMDPFLTYSDDRALREQVWRTYYSRGDNGDAHDNNAIIAEILQLRDERVALLGYESYAAWRLENRMAGTPQRAMELMRAVWPAAVARAKQEVADMQAVADAERAKITIEPWDYRYYAEKVRQRKYALDSNEVSQYLQLDRLREAMFMVAGRLFDFAFTPVPEGTVPVFHPDVKVWEVTRASSGEHVGLWYLDPFARPGKRSGAWASSYRGHTTFDGLQTVLSSNNSNFIAGAPGEPVLLSWDDAQTYFHEFGHALHALSSTVEYRTLNGGVRDYTEFQSQLLERWLLTDEVIDGFLVHHRTGEPMPKALVAKIRRAATFNQGFGTTEYLASALLDLEYHSIDPTGIDPDAFERTTLEALGMPPQVVMRHRSPHFTHVFSGEGYAAGYYGYLWADVLTADAAEAFAKSKGGFYDPQWSAKLVEHLFAPRNAVDPAEAYRAFRGRDATIDALMRDRGFPVPRRRKR